MARKQSLDWRIEENRTQMVGQAIGILSSRASRKAWLAKRRLGIGASEMATVVMGSTPYSSRFSLWWEKSAGWETEETEAMRHGKGLEPYIAKEFAALYPHLRVQRPPHGLYMHFSHPWMLCTPDRLAYDGEQVNPVEFKTDESGAWGKPGTGEIPQHHRIQVMQQCAIFGSPLAYVVRFAHKRITVYEVQFNWSDPSIVAEFEGMVRAGEAFLASVAANDEPHPDGHSSTSKAIKKAFPNFDPDLPAVMFEQSLIDQYETLHDAYKYAEDRFRDVENRVRRKLAASKEGITPNGDVFVARSVYVRRGYSVEAAVVDQLKRRKPRGN